VIAQQVGRRHRHAGIHQQVKFEQAGGASVAVSEGVNPGDVKVRQHGFENCERHLPIRAQAGKPLVQPLAQALHQIRAVFRRGSTIHGPHQNRVLPIGSRHHTFVHGKIPQHFPVEMLDHLRRHLRVFTRPDKFGYDPVAFPDNVFHFLGQIRLAGRKLQRALHVLKHLALRQRVPLDRRGRASTFG
jgi:hypothetical protein